MKGEIITLSSSLGASQTITLNDLQGHLGMEAEQLMQHEF